MDKKGDLTSTQIIMLVIAVVGFLIVLAALFLVNLGGYSETDICKLSVLSRATAPSAIQAAVPLKCKTSKICLTQSYFGGGCKEQFAGEENVDYVHLSGTPAQKARQIEEVSANAMYDCWSMMGEGKLWLFNEYVFGDKAATCVVCSRVAVDNNVSEEVLNLVDVDEYMKTHQVPGSSFTYLDTFGVSSYTSFDKGVFDAKKTDSKINIKDEQYAGNPNYDVAFVFSQIKSEGVGDVLFKMGVIGGTLGAATFVSPVGKLASKLLFTPTGIVVAGVAVGTAVTYGTIRAYEGQKAAAGYCGNVKGYETEEGSVPGCSVVQAVSYNFKDINAICDEAIQGEL